jgi:hypothetical protein
MKVDTCNENKIVINLQNLTVFKFDE